VQARTGPDGALWIVDMYRYVIEHSRWIPPEMQEELDVYAGNTLGRIYRVLPKDAKHQPLPRFDKLETANLAAAMDTLNGTQRDMIQQQLVWRGDATAAEPLAKVAAKSSHPAARMQALCTLDLLDKLRDEQIEAAFHDAHPAVRRQAVRLAESRFKSPKLLTAAAQLADDPDAFVALQVACSLGETTDQQKIEPLYKLLKSHADDAYITTAIMSSLTDDEMFALNQKLFAEGGDIPIELWSRLYEFAGSSSSPELVSAAVHGSGLFFVRTKREEVKPEQLAPLESLVEGLRRNPRKTKALSEDAAVALRSTIEDCMRIADEQRALLDTRVKCIRIVGGAPQVRKSVVAELREYLSAEHDSELQLAAIDALSARNDAGLAEALLNQWRSFTPALRAHVLDVLLTRKNWAAALVAAIDEHTVAAPEIDATHRSRLAEYPDADVRQKAAASLAQDVSRERAAVAERYQSKLKKGDPERGKAVFEKNCAACHRLHDIGSQVGPDIASRADKSNEGLLREILDPNRAVDQRFAEYIAVTSDGVIKNGILVDETSGAITLRGQQGQETKLLRSELDSLTSSGKSLMPEGFENQITPEEMSDLLAFLASP
jgi:putative heme-binding domain-containing protein